jgi:hypothetical protein
LIFSQEERVGSDWLESVNAAQTEVEIEALRRCVNRDTLYGTETWKTQRRRSD